MTQTLRYGVEPYHTNVFLCYDKWERADLSAQNLENNLTGLRIERLDVVKCKEIGA